MSDDVMDPQRPAIAAAALESGRSSRLLLVVVDASSDEIDVKLVDEGLIAHGSGPCTVRLAGRGAVTALAGLTLHSDVDAPGIPVDVNLAVTWAVVPERGGAALDVAGTAYVFKSCELRPEAFRARRRDPFNSLDLPELDRGPEQVEEAERKPRRTMRRWTSPARLPFPPRGPRPRWVAIRLARR